MKPAYDMVEWAEELGIKDAKDRPWDWLGDLMVFDDTFLPFVCACGLKDQTPWWKPPPLSVCPDNPSFEKIEMKRFAESEYMVGQCARCKRIIWLRAQIV